jgi:hypothetical protein
VAPDHMVGKVVRVRIINDMTNSLTGELVV